MTALHNNGDFFKVNKSKVFGIEEHTTDRFGKPVVVITGTMEDVIRRLKVEELPKAYDHFQEGRNIATTKDGAQEKSQKIKKILAATSSESSNKKKNGGKCGKDLICLADSIKRNNPKLSKDEIKVWVTYQTLKGLFDLDTIAKN